MRWFDAPSCYVFHTLNAYDDVAPGDGDAGTGGHDRVVLDVVRHPRMFAAVTNGPDEGDTVLERWTLDLRSGTLVTETLDDRSQEFPRIDERRTGLPHRYGYGAAFGGGSSTGPRSSTTSSPARPRSTSTAPAGSRSSRCSCRARPTAAPIRPTRTTAGSMSYVYDATTDRSTW